MIDLSGARVLITGGAGFVGSAIADQLLEEGIAHVTLLDNLVRGRLENLYRAGSSGQVELVIGDICDAQLVGQLMDGVDIVFHQAALRITQCAEEPRLAVNVMAEGTFNVLHAAVQAHVGKIVAASSASVYGMASQFPTAEDHSGYDNRTLYGAAKLFNEGMLRSFNDMYGLDYVALRYFNVYGPRMDLHGVYTEVLVRWMERISRGEPPLIFGDGRQTMDFVYVADVARANLLAARASVTDSVYNVATGVETSLEELAEALLRVMDSDLHLEFGPERTVNSVRRRQGDTTAASRHLGFEAQIGLEQGLRNTLAWWQQEREVTR